MAKSLSQHTLVLLTYLFLILGPLVVFWQVKNFDFINYDDTTAVTENNYTPKGITPEGVRWALTSGYDANWLPLVRLSHMLDVQLFGMNPGWHHRTNLLLHIANTMLLFFILHRMTKAHWESAFVAALFALHPLHVESVAWIAERKDVLSGAFWFLTMGAYWYYTEDRRWQRYMVLVAVFALGLTAKPMLVTLPFVLLLVDYWPLRRFGRAGADAGVKGKAGEWTASGRHEWAALRPLIGEKVPLFGLAAASGVITFMVQNAGGAVASTETFPLALRMQNALVSYAAYIGTMLWPRDLAVFYPYPDSLPAWQVIGAALVLTAATVAVVRLASKAPYAVVGWLWYVGTLVPVIGIVQVGLQARADRYTYLPLIGLFIIAAWGASALTRNWRYRKGALAASAAVVLACLSLATWTQAGYWQDSTTLFEHALTATRNNHLAYNHVGTVQVQRGNYREAIRCFDRSLEIYPQDATTLYNRGTAYLHLGSFKQALDDLDRSIAIEPNKEKARINRGIAHASLGNFQQAIADYDKALEINAGSSEARFNRGTVYANLGSYRQAVADYDRAIAINPGYGAAYNSRGSARLLLGSSEQAVDDFRTAARLGNRAARERLNKQGIGW